MGQIVQYTHIYLSRAHIQLRSWTSGGLVGGVRCLLYLSLPLDWWISIQLEHVSHLIPGPTDSENSIPVKSFWVGVW